MNTNEFYKQLMEQYAFDNEKIKNNVLNPSSARHKNGIGKWIAMASAAAVITVTVGTAAFIGFGSGNKPIDILTAAERLQIAQDAYDQAGDSTNEAEMYVTFTQPQTPSNMQNILAKASSNGDIKVITVYMDNKTTVTGSQQIEQLFETEENLVVAVKIKCPQNILRVVADMSDVYLVEKGDTFDNNSFSVIETEATEETTQVDPPAILPDPNDETEETTAPETTVETTTTTEAETTVTTDITTAQTEETKPVTEETTTAAEETSAVTTEPTAPAESVSVNVVKQGAAVELSAEKKQQIIAVAEKALVENGNLLDLLITADDADKYAKTGIVVGVEYKDSKELVVGTEKMKVSAIKILYGESESYVSYTTKDGTNVFGLPSSSADELLSLIG